MNGLAETGEASAEVPVWRVDRVKLRGSNEGKGPATTRRRAPTVKRRCKRSI